MNWLQRLLTRLLPPAAAGSLEAESRRWGFHCRRCGHREPLWEAGGIRWKAAGNPRVLRRCRGCGRIGWLRLEQAPADPAAPAADGAGPAGS